MTDEETDDEEGGFITHKPHWRSALVEKLIQRLDQRYEEMRKKRDHSKPREQRHPGSPSIRVSPKGAPSWSIQQQCSESQESLSPSTDDPTFVAEPQITPCRPSTTATARTLPFDSNASDSDLEPENSDTELDTMIRAATDYNL